MQITKTWERENSIIARIDVKPHSRTILYGNKPYYVKFPWLLFYVTFLKKDGKICYSQMCIRSVDGKIPLIPHIDNQGFVCLSEQPFYPKGKNIDILCDKIVGRFFSSRFNNTFDPLLFLLEAEEKEFVDNLERGLIGLWKGKNG